MCEPRNPAPPSTRIRALSSRLIQSPVRGPRDPEGPRPGPTPPPKPGGASEPPLHAGPTRLQSDSSPFVSIVIPVRNEGRTIDDCLAAMVRQTMSSDRCEILVIDGQSTDDTADDKVRHGPALTHVSSCSRAQNRTAPAALNLRDTGGPRKIIARMAWPCRRATRLSRTVSGRPQATDAWCAGGPWSDRHDSSVGRCLAATMSPFGVGDALHDATPGTTLGRDGLSRHVATLGVLAVGLFDEELVATRMTS